MNAKVSHTRLASLEDINGILALQEVNLQRYISPHEWPNGFVTTPFTRKLLEDIITMKGAYVADNEIKEIIGYTFAGDWAYFQQWDIFKLMCGLLEHHSYQDLSLTLENTFQYGPICIAEEYRGQMLFQKLFEEMRRDFVKLYPVCITFINAINARSMKAHREKLNWQVLEKFDFNDNVYYLLAYNMSDIAYGT